MSEKIWGCFVINKKDFLLDYPVHTFTLSLIGGGEVNISIYGNVNGRRERCFVMDDYTDTKGMIVRCRFDVKGQVEKVARLYIKRRGIPVGVFLREEHYIGFSVLCKEGTYRLITEFFSTDRRDRVRANSYVLSANGTSIMVRRRLVGLDIKSHAAMMFYANRFWGTVDVDAFVP